MRSTAPQNDTVVTVTLDQLRQLVTDLVRAQQGIIPGSLLRLPQVLSIIPVGKVSWYRGITAGIYPQPVPLTGRTVAWRAEDVLAVAARLAAQPWTPHVDERRSKGRTAHAETKRRAKALMG